MTSTACHLSTHLSFLPLSFGDFGNETEHIGLLLNVGLCVLATTVTLVCADFHKDGTIHVQGIASLELQLGNILV